MIKEDFENGKYTVIFNEETGELKALRHGKEWQDLTGNKLILAMLQSVESMRLKFAAMVEASKCAR